MPRRHHQPAQPHRRRERLARRAGVDDALGVHALQRPHRRAVVAELGIVVVLDGQRGVPPQPVEQRPSPGAREHRARRILVRRRHQHRVHRRTLERVHPEPFAVHRHGHQLELRVRRRHPHFVMAGVLDRDPSRAHRGQRLPQQVPPLDPAAGDHYAVRVGHHAAHAAEVVAEGEPEDIDAMGIGVAEIGVPHPAERLAEGAEPGGARERRQIGEAGAEVVERRWRRVRTRSGGRLGGSRAAGDPRPGAGPQLQVPLAGELGVRLYHDRAGHAQLAGEISGRGKPRTGMQARVPDRLSKLVLDLAAEGQVTVPVHRDEHIEGATGQGFSSLLTRAVAGPASPGPRASAASTRACRPHGDPC